MRRPAQIILHRPLISNIFISTDASEMMDHLTISRVSSADYLYVRYDNSGYHAQKFVVSVDKSAI